VDNSREYPFRREEAGPHSGPALLFCLVLALYPRLAIRRLGERFLEQASAAPRSPYANLRLVASPANFAACAGGCIIEPAAELLSVTPL
jgi:hypothetical protein